jgi:hypothetical protein
MELPELYQKQEEHEESKNEDIEKLRLVKAVEHLEN